MTRQPTAAISGERRIGRIEFGPERFLSPAEPLSARNVLQVLKASWPTDESAEEAESRRRAAMSCFAALQVDNPDAYDGHLVGLRRATLVDGPVTDLVRRDRTACGTDARAILEAVPVRFSEYLATRDRLLPAGWHRADPLGTTVVATTADGAAVASIRARTAAFNPGALYLLGGFCEMRRDRHGNPYFDVFEDAHRETIEETGLDPRLVLEPKLIGLAYDPEIPHPEAFFHLEIDMTRSELDAHLIGTTSNEFERVFTKPLDEAIDEFAAGSAADRPGCVPTTWSYKTAMQFVSMQRPT